MKLKSLPSIWYDTLQTVRRRHANSTCTHATGHGTTDWSAQQPGRFLPYPPPPTRNLGSSSSSSRRSAPKKQAVLSILLAFPHQPTPTLRTFVKREPRDTRWQLGGQHQGSNLRTSVPLREDFLLMSALYTATMTRMEFVEPAVASFIPWMHTTLSPAFTQPCCLPMSMARKTIESVPIIEPITCSRECVGEKGTRTQAGRQTQHEVQTNAKACAVIKVIYDVNRNKKK